MAQVTLTSDAVVGLAIPFLDFWPSCQGRQNDGLGKSKKTQKPPSD